MHFACRIVMSSKSSAELETMYPDNHIHALYTASKKDVISHTIAKVLSITRLQRFRYTEISKLSIAEKRRLSVAIRLIESPAIFVIDEPTNGLTTPEALGFIQLLKNIVVKYNCTVIISMTHAQRRSVECIDWIVSLKDGYLICQVLYSVVFCFILF